MDDDLDLDEPAGDVVLRLADDAADDGLPDDLPNGDLSGLHGDEECANARWNGTRQAVCNLGLARWLPNT